MTVEEIVRDLVNGEDVYLKEGVYDFTGYHSIPVTSKFICGNGAIIKNTELYETGVNDVDNAQITFLFHAYTGSYFEGLHIIGPNGGLGSLDYNKLFGAINILESSDIINCTFEDCDKWGIRVENKGAIMLVSNIVGCTFKNIKRQGYGYGIWNQYGSAVVNKCNFSGCRHGLDMSSKRACYLITECNFDKSNYIHINMHGYGDGDRSGDKIQIKYCNFYDTMQPLQLKLPYTSTGYVEVHSNNFLVSEDKVGLVDTNKLIRTFNNPQFHYFNNTFNGDKLLAAPIIDGPSTINVGQDVVFSINNYFDNSIYDINWSISDNKEFKILNKFDGESRVMTIEATAINKITNERSIVGYKVISIINSKDIFSFNIAGVDSIVEVFKDGVFIDKISLTDGKWVFKSYSNDTKFELKLSGSGYVLIDNWFEKNGKRMISSAFETESKLKFVYNSLNTIKVGIIKGEAFNGNCCAKITLNGQGDITVKNNVDK